MNKDLVKQFKKAGFKINYSQGDYINIARPDGMHCEFYPCGPNDDVFTATYIIKDKKTELDFYMPDDADLFVETVKEILK